MSDIKIQLHSTQEVLRFNHIITKYKCDFDLEVGHNYVDAKSLLGIYSLTLKRPMILHIQAEDKLLDEIVAELEQFICMDNLAYEY